MLKFEIDNDNVYIIGQPLLEVKSLLSLHAEEAVLKSLQQFIKLNFSNKGVRYITHRREDPRKIAKLPEDYEVLFLDYPFEIFPLIKKQLPKNIICFTSTVAVSYAKFNPHAKILSLKINKCFLSKAAIDFHEKIYQEFKEFQSIKVCELPKYDILMGFKSH